ncbi:MAG: hypothetical protein AAGN46_14090 [Acidobacteriota bacterium]
MADFDDLDSLDDLDALDDLDDLPPLDAADSVADDSTHPVVLPPTSGLATVIEDLLAKRNYRQVLQIAENQQQAVASDPRVGALVNEARSKLEQEAYLESFLDGARQARAAGNLNQSKEYFLKARALDAQHPAVRAFVAEMQSSALSGGGPQAPAAPAAPVAPAAPPPAAPAASSVDFGGDEAPLVFAEDSGPDFGGGFEVDPIDDPPPLVEDPSATPDASAPDLDDSVLALDAFPEIGADADLLGAAPGTPADSFDAAPADPAAGLGAPEGVIDLEAEASDDQSERIEQLLEEGRAQMERGELQGAIDVWSRIFLIDIDNTEAAGLIEEARGRKAEFERQAEEAFQRAGDQIEAGDLDAAQASLREALEGNPGHVTAADWLRQLEAGDVPEVQRGETEEAPDLLDDGGFGALQDAAGVGEGQTLQAAVERDRVVVVKRTDRRLVALGAVVGLVVLGLGAFLVTRWDSLFPNSEADLAARPPRVDPIERANQMYEQGKVENAIQVLEKVPQPDPAYDQAQALIAQWSAEIETSDEFEADAGPSAEQIVRRELLLDAGREAFEQRRFLLAGKYFDRANKIQVLETEDLGLRRNAEQQLQAFAQELSLFEDGRYEEAIPLLWRQREASPDNRDVEQLLVDSYYNLALQDLQRENPSGAAEKLTDALDVQPDSDELTRMKLFAESYARRSPDMLYRIYVKYLPSRL